MKNIPKAILFLFSFFIVVTSFAQSSKWSNKMNDKNSNFYDIQKEAKDYWKNKKIEKGKGWKQFKRWENFWEPRVYPTGVFPAPNITSVEIQKFRKNNIHKRNGQQLNTGNWKAMGPTSWGTTSYNPGLGRINAIAVDPKNSQIIYAGAPSGGLWKSTDGGNSWITNTDNLDVIGVSGIAIHPVNSNIIYIATGDGDATDTYSIGVLKSTDGGQTFAVTGLNWTIYEASTIYKISIHPVNPDTVIVAASDGVYRSADGGATFSLVQSGYLFYDVEFMPGNPYVVYASASMEFYRSNNSGISFTKITSGFPNPFDAERLEIGVTPANPNLVYLVASDDLSNGYYGLFRSTDAGINFTTMSTSPNILGYSTDASDNGGQGWYDLTIAVSPTNENEVYVGGINLWKSTDGGINWNILTYWVYGGGFPYVHADQHELEFFGSSLYAGCDGGIFRSNDAGTSWNDLSAGMQITQIYRIGAAANNANLIMAGVQDNGSFRNLNNSWTHVMGGDGMECAVDWNNNQVVYSTSQFGNLNISTDQGNNFNDITPTLWGGAWITPYQLNPLNSNSIYAGYDSLFKSDNQGSSWSIISNSISFTDYIRSIAVSPSDSNTIYTASYYEIFKTANGGTSWVNISTGLPFASAVMTYIAVDPENAQKLWVTFSGYSSGNKVFKSENGGSTWINVSGTLPNIPANCIVFEKGSSDGIYVGSDVGVYYRDSSMSDWIEFKTSLPNVIINELEIFYPTGKLRAATYGRGLWESYLYSTLSAPLTATFTATDTAFCDTINIQFTDQSIGNIISWSWSFPGGSPSSSVLQNPIIEYSTPGNYDVTLIVSDGVKNDTLIKTDYINPKPTNLIALGTSANLYTVLENSANIIDANQDLNTITFIHRNNSKLFGGVSGQYRYDVSKDGGASWITDIGVVNPTSDNASFISRYPQVSIYNPLSNTIPDSAYIAYSGTYLNGTKWFGLNTGVAKLSNNSSTFTENYIAQRNGNVSISSGLSKGANGILWSINWSYNNTTGDLKDILINKGVFNNSTKTFDWTYDSISTPHNLWFDGLSKVSGYNLSFDPSGKYGWVVFLGHVLQDSNFVFQPVFYKTIDFGTVWTGPYTLDLSNFANIDLALDTIGGGTGIPTTAFETDMVVDSSGNPHLLVVIGSGITYSIQSSLDMFIYDITYDKSSDSWYSIMLDTIKTLRRNVTTTVTQDNRPSASLSVKGDKVFFTWVDNYLPDLMGKGFDINSMKGTPTVNFTADDCTWKERVYYSSVSPHALKNGSINFIPALFTKLNINNDELDTTYFFFYNNVKFDDAQFTETMSISQYATAFPTADFNAFDTTLCNGDTVQFLDQSQGGPDTWSWFFEGGTPSSSTERNPKVSYKTIGTYMVSLTVTNNLGMDSISKTGYIKVGDKPIVSGLITNDVSCFGAADGNIELTLTGGVTPYSYAWSNGNTNEDLSGLGPDTLSVIITDNFGCSIFAYDTIFESAKLIVNATGKNISCYESDDGNVSANVNGGTSPYLYFWNTGATTSSISNLLAGNYYLTVSDNNNCSASNTVIIIQPDSITLNSAVKNASCGNLNGSVTASAYGGTGTLNYSWSNGFKTQSINNLDSGIFTVTVKDVNGCMKNMAASVKNTPTLVLYLTGNDLLCNVDGDGSAKVSVSGGTSPFTYLWDDPLLQTTPEINGLPGGVYTVTITDGANCIATDSITINEPDSLVLFISSTDESAVGAADGNANATAAGGTAPYSFKWSNGGIISAISNLTAGIYSVIVTDANGCSASDTISVGVGETIQDFYGYGNISVFPNPTDNILTIRYPEYISITLIEIYNSLGEEMLYHKASKTKNGQIDLNLKGCEEGIYYLRITTKENVVSKRVMLIKAKSK